MNFKTLFPNILIISSQIVEDKYDCFPLPTEPYLDKWELRNGSHFAIT